MKNMIPYTAVSGGQELTEEELIKKMRGEDGGVIAGEDVKGVIPKTVVSDAELDRLREMLASGSDLVVKSDGSFGPDDGSFDNKDCKKVPETVVSDAELDRLREMLASGSDLVVKSDGSFGPDDGSFDNKDCKKVPETVVSDEELDRLRELLDQGECVGGTEKFQNEDASSDPKRIVPSTVVSAAQWYESNPGLALCEIEGMRREYNNPGMTPHLSKDDKSMYWLLNLRPNLGAGHPCRSYTIMLRYTRDHPSQKYGTSVHAIPLKPSAAEMIWELRHPKFLQDPQAMAVLTEDERRRVQNVLEHPGCTHMLNDPEIDGYFCTTPYSNTSGDLAAGATSAVESSRYAYRYITVFELAQRDPKTWLMFNKEGEI